MDNIKEYVEMCEKAEEIQKMKDLREGNFVFCKLTKHAYFIHGLEETAARNYKERYVWLPRQDQLQEIYLETGSVCNQAKEMFEVFAFWLEEKKSFNTTMTCPFSGEQLWMMYLMEERYNQIWDGNDWQERQG